jgi:tape measure domain-containing protein
MAAPQLRLEVSLNLAGFRNEVRKLTQIAQSEFNPLLKVNVDTKDYRAQLKALERIKPVIKIEDRQIDAARARIGTLHKSLATLRRATSTPIEIKLKYTEIGKPPSTAAGQVGRAVSGGVRGSQALEGANRSELLNIRKMMSEAGMALGKITSLSKATASELRNSIIPAFTNSGEEAVNGLAAGLKDSSSKIGKIAAKVGVEAVNGIKGALGIASPSRVFKQIGEFSVDGLELGFLNGLKDFKGKSVAEIRKIVALLKLELAKVSEGGGIGGPSMGSLRRQLVGQRAYTSPIGPLPVGSREPYAKGTRGQFGYSGYEPRMVSRPYTGGPRFPVEGMMAPRPEFGFASTGQSQPTGQAAGRSPENTILGAMGGYNPGVRSSAMFPMGGMMGPSSPLGRITPQSSMFGGGGGGGGSGGGGASPFGGMRLNVPQLPGSGVVRELGEEFGFAAKQVLLFGTAYKALAFLQSFPGQVGEAVGALQSFRNTLKTVTPSTAEFDKSNKFILSLVDQYNVPLQSARDGFAKLYASMKPAGFSGAEIRGLFEGVSMGVATFGMSADKVDRVMYAFAQMASKGQVMSEELKGQLGDVLPGALSLFAKAADMSVQEFGQAMEDGAFKGEAMRQLLVNVGATMKEEFGKGAVGAAVTYQGVMNRLQTTTVLFYEAFEPAAVAFANTFILPITNGIRIVTDAFAQLLTGQKAITQGGSELAARMQPLIPIFQGIGDNLRQVATAAFNTVKALLPVVQFLLQLAASPVIGFLAQMYASLLLLNGAFTLLGGRLLIGVIASLAQTAIRMTALNAATVITNGSLAGTQLQLRMLSAGFAQTGAAATGFAMTMRTAMMTTVVGAIVAAVAIGIAEFMRLRGVMASIEGRYKSLGDQARLMGEAGNVSGVQKITTQVKEQAQTYEDLAKALNRAEKAGGFLKLDQKGRELLKRTGQSGFDAGTGIITNEDANKIKDAINRNREETKNLLGGVLPGQESKARAEVAKLDAKLEKQKIDLSAGDDTGKPPKEQSLESYYSLQNQLADANTQAEIERIEAQFEHARAMVNAEYDLREARANSFQKKAIAFQREIFAITADRDAALLKSRNKILAESGKVAGGAGGMGGGTAGAYLQGNIGPTSTGPHFDVKKMGGGYFPRNYLDQYVQVNGKPLSSGTTVPGGTFAAHQRRNSHGWDYAFGGGRQAATLTGGAEWMGGAPTAHGEARKFKLPTGEEFQFLHGKSEGIGERAGAPRPVAGSERKRTVAEAKTQLSMNEMRAAAIEKEAEATKGLEIATAKYVQSIVPTSEQQLQNQLLAQRIDLTRNSFSPEILEAQLAFAEQQIEATENIKLNEEAIKTLTAAQGDNSKQINALTDANNQLKANLPVSAIQLYSKSINEQVLLLAQRNDAAKKDAADQERISDLIIGGMSRQAAEAKLTADNLKNNYKKALEEATRQVDIAAAAEEAFAITKRMSGTLTEAQTAQYNALADALKKAREERERLEGMAPAVESTATGIESIGAPKTAKSYIADAKDETQQELDQLTNWGYQVAEGGKAIGSAFGQAFKDIVSGSVSAREALANMMQSIADHFLDMAAQIIAKQITMIIYGTIMKVLGLTAGASSAGGGLSSGFDAGGASALPTDAGGWSQSFATSLKFANGGIAAGGFTAFANGGMVTGPTMGLVGEGKYNEAIVPLPDGKSIPVQMTGSSGGGSLRDAMNSNSVTNSSPVLNMSFQSTSINGVEYVSRDQLESAMAETRRNATRDGAKRGMTMTLDRIQNSSSTRRKVGI